MVKISRKKIVLGLSAVLLAFIIIFAFYAERSLVNLAENQAKRVLQMPVDITGVAVELLEAKVSLFGVKVYHPDEKNQLIAEVPRLTVKLINLSLGGEAGWPVEVHLLRHRILFETDRRGEWVLSGRVPLLRRGEGEVRLKPFNVEKISIDDGEIEFRDRRVSSPPTVTKVTKIELRLSRLRLPTAEESLPSEFKAGFLVGSAGRFEVKGNGDFLSPKTSFNAKLSVRKLPLPPYAPYYSNGLPVSIRSGVAHFSTQAECQNDLLNIPLRAEVSDLDIELKKKNAPKFASDMAVDALKNDQGNVEVDLLIKGNLKRPRIIVLTDFNKAVLAGLSQPFKSAGTKIKDGTKSGFRKVKGFFSRDK